MNIDRLVAMANDIANFFIAEAGPEDAPEQIAAHIRKFWDPRMRIAIAAHAQKGGDGLSAPALAAARLLVPSAAPAGER